jgi:hypothetical protein
MLHCPVVVIDGRLWDSNGPESCFIPTCTPLTWKKVVRRFYHLFYHIHLTEEQIHEILHHAKSCIRTGTGITIGRPL